MSFVVPHPVEIVFGFLRDFENFPQFVGALREVRDYGDGRSRWCATTPSGGSIEWETVTTKYVPNCVIAWESAGASPVRMSATLRFLPEGRSTCLKVVARYQVLESGFADAIAALATPRRESALESDIRRLSTYLDTVVARSASVASEA